MNVDLHDPADAQHRLHALSESRERWRSLVQLGADFAFETDAQGHFCVVTPDPALGWPAEHLIGTPAEALLIGAGGGLFNPFRATGTRRRRRVWLRDASGAAACLLLSVAPLPGRPRCVRGIGVDMTVQERYDSELAATLRRRETMRAITLRMRRAAVPFASLTIALEELLHAVDAQGASLVLHEEDAPLRVAAKAGQAWPAAIEVLHDAVLASCDEAPDWLAEQTRQTVEGGRSLLLCGSTNHFIDRAVLAVWRDTGAWSEHETALASSLLGAMQPVLEHEQIQRETARQSRTDVLTGLFNRQGFTFEMSRRFDRLDNEGLPATLMVLGLDGMDPVNAKSGLEAGDQMLCCAASVLRDGVRPTDLAGRLGGDLFALWLDGADQFAAAERAEGLVRTGVVPGDPAGARLSVSIGLAVRASRSFESIESLLHRAWRAMRSIKQSGGSGWQVSAEEPTP